DDIHAYTGLLTNRVFGTAPPNANMYITVTSFLTLDNYVTPGNGITYAHISADASGNFSASQFYVNGSATPGPATFALGTTGFVRVKHANGDEVYTVHGQSAQVLENSNVVSGYAFPLATALTGLDNSVLTTRPLPAVVVTLADSLGGVKGTASAVGS